VTVSGWTAVLIVCVFSLGRAEQAPPPNTSLRESTVTATVERIERSSRVVTLRSDNNTFQTVYVEKGVTQFDDLKVGDVVTVRYTESVIVEVRPTAKLVPPQDTTQEARRRGVENVVEQLNTVVTIDSIDPQGLFVTYRTYDNRRIMRAVSDKALLEGIRPGDRIEITVTRARAVSIERESR
jgi:hypothetical protein